MERKHTIKINKARSWFSEKTNNTDKPMEGVIKKKKETQISIVKNVLTYPSDRKKKMSLDIINKYTPVI